MIPIRDKNLKLAILLLITSNSWHYNCPRSILSVNSILARCVALWNTPLNTGNARFHAQFQLDLYSFDQNILSFESSLF